MSTKLRLGIAGLTFAAVAALIYLSGSSYAGGGDDLNKKVQVIADLIKKGDKEGAKKKAAEAAKKIEDVDELMQMFRPRNKKGMGVGVTAGSNPSKDGIEVALRDLARDVPSGVAKQSEALEQTGYWIAALGEVAAAKAPPKDQGKKTKKAWIGWSEDMRSAGLDFAKAAKAKGGQEIKTAAAKVNAACNNCHSVFKE